MENAADALKIAFAVFVLIIAIILMFNLVSQAKNTSDALLYYADETRYYDEYALKSNQLNRQVGVAEVISTLYRYYNESLSVTVKLSDTDITTFDITRENKNENQIQNGLESYINHLLSIHNINDIEFEETFLETLIDGEYVTGEDGTTLITKAGQKKIYITYVAN